MTAQTAERPKVFVSYSHRDKYWKEHLVTHPDVLQKQGLLSFWEDRQIRVGDDWPQKIRAAMGSANVAVLLVSPHFLTSDFIRSEEVGHLLERREQGGSSSSRSS